MTKKVITRATAAPGAEMLGNLGQLTPIADYATDDLAPEHMLFLNVLYTYFEDVKKYGKINCAETRAEKWEILTSLASHPHTRNLCSVVGINHKFFMRTLREAIENVEKEKGKKK